MKKIIDRKFCVAPMMGYTTPYARNLYRILSKKTFLFSEMIATKTLIHSKNTQSVIANEKQNPIACLLYTSPSPRDGLLSRMPSSA